MTLNISPVCFSDFIFTTHHFYGALYCTIVTRIVIAFFTLVEQFTIPHYKHKLKKANEKIIYGVFYVLLSFLIYITRALSNSIESVQHEKIILTFERRRIVSSWPRKKARSFDGRETSTTPKIILPWSRWRPPNSRSRKKESSPLISKCFTNWPLLTMSVNIQAKHLLVQMTKAVGLSSSFPAIFPLNVWIQCCHICLHLQSSYTWDHASLNSGISFRFAEIEKRNYF